MSNENKSSETKDQAQVGTSNTESLSTKEGVDNSSKTKQEYDNVKNQTTESGESIKENMVGNAIIGTEAKSNAYILHAEAQTGIDLETYRLYTEVLTQLIFEIDGCIKTAKYQTGLNQSGKQTLKTANEKLKQYKDIMKDKKRMIEHEFNVKNRLNNRNPDKAPLTVKISNAEISELKNRWFMRKQQIEFDIKEGQSGKSSNIAPRPNQSIEQIQRGNYINENHIDYDKRLNEALKDAAFLRIFDNNQDAARSLLEGIANNTLSDQQITFCQIHMQELSPHFENYGLRDQVYRAIQTRGGRYNQSMQAYGNIDGKTAYKAGGITGRLNNTLIKAFPNAKPEQVSNLTNIAVAAGGIYAIYRIGKRFFGRNSEGKRNLLGKTAILAGGYFIPQLLVGKDGYSLLGEILSGKADFSELRYRAGNCLRFLHNNSPEVYAQMAPGILGMSIFPQTYTVDNVRSLQQTFSDQNARKQWYSSTYNRLNKDNSALANEFKNTFNENQYNENEWKIFLAKLGITDKTKGDALIFDEAAKIADKKTSFELYIKSQGKKRNPAFRREIDNYLKQNGDFNPDDVKGWLIDDNDAKYTNREEDFKNKEAINNKVDDLPLNSEKKSELKEALESFYDERSIDSKPNPNDFSLRIENGLLILRSNGGHECKIKLDTREIEGFGPGITFSNLADLLNTADLTNKILETQKGKIAVGEPIFKYKSERKGICFNDANNIRKDIMTWDNSGHDTRVLSTSRRWKIRWQNNQNVMYNHPEEYAAYLSERRLEENKINVDPTKYENVKRLSDYGIIFTNEKEVQELETRLKQVKDLKKFSIGDLGGKPYRTTREWFNTKLKFINVDGKTEIFAEDIAEKFPTIIVNKDKFLAYMNNKDNGMRGSEITNRTGT